MVYPNCGPLIPLYDSPLRRKKKALHLFLNLISFVFRINLICLQHRHPKLRSSFHHKVISLKCKIDDKIVLSLACGPGDENCTMAHLRWSTGGRCSGEVDGMARLEASGATIIELGFRPSGSRPFCSDEVGGTMRLEASGVAI